MSDRDAVQAETPVEIVDAPVVEAPAVEPVAVEAVEAEPEGEVEEAPLTQEERVEVGSILERTAWGWSARLHYGGAVRLFGDGRTIADALTAAGIV